MANGKSNFEASVGSMVYTNPDTGESASFENIVIKFDGNFEQTEKEYIAQLEAGTKLTPVIMGGLEKIIRVVRERVDKTNIRPRLKKDFPGAAEKKAAEKIFDM